MNDLCACNKPVEWTEWNYFEVNGYRVKHNKCECQRPMMRAEPFSKEKKSIWNKIKSAVLGEL